MKHLPLKLCVLLLGVGINSNAQNATTAAGGNGSGNGGTLSYSIGQVVYTTESGSNGSVAKGVQHPYEIYIVSGLRQETSFLVELSVFPNPTTGILSIQVTNFNNEKLSYQLLDIEGKLLESKAINAKQTSLNMSSFSTATYFLNILQDNNQVQSFKIIKH